MDARKPDPTTRCRLVLVAPRHDNPSALAAMLETALAGGDVASVIVPQYDLDEHAFQRLAATLVPVIQSAGAAALIAGDTRIAGRVKADGLHIGDDPDRLAEAIERHAPAMIVGGGNARDRHSALAIGELRPDYVFFGKLDGDIRPQPHPKTLALAGWWAPIIEIPCIVMGGSDIAGVVGIAATGAEFAALRRAVFDEAGAAAMRVAEANALLDEQAPLFEESR